MANTLVDRKKLIERVSDVFRQRGFDGTSLSHLVAATGLQRASLYHHFPGGKEEIARAVMQQVDEKFAADVLQPLTQNINVADKAAGIGERLSEFYFSGEKACLLNAFSFDDCTTELQGHVGNSFTALLNAFAGLALESGFSETEARRRAEDTMIKIQGSLVFARAAKNTAPFQRVIKELPDLLTQ